MKKFLVSLILILLIFQVSAQLGFDDSNIPRIDPPSPSLLTSDNTWTGTNTFEDDVTFDAEVYGTPHVIQTGEDAQIAMTKSTLYYMHWVDGVQFTNAPKGWTAEQDGSIIGMSITYDVVASGGTGFPVLSFKTLVNGVSFGSASVGGGASVGNQQSAILTWARDTYTFNAGDNLETVMVMNGFGGTPTVTVDDVLITTRIVYD